MADETEPGSWETSWRYPNKVGSLHLGGDIYWNNLTASNLGPSDLAYTKFTTITVGLLTPVDHIFTSNYGFSLASTAIIDSMSLRMKWFTTSSSTTDLIVKDIELSLNQTTEFFGIISGIPWPSPSITTGISSMPVTTSTSSSNAVYSIGYSTHWDLGSTLVPSFVNDPLFGSGLQIIHDNGIFLQLLEIRVYDISIKMAYTIPDPNPPTPGQGSANLLKMGTV